MKNIYYKLIKYIVELFVPIVISFIEGLLLISKLLNTGFLLVN